MARTTAEIQATMDVEQANQPALTTLNSTSQTAIYTLFKYIVAKCMNVFEQLWDKKQAEIEAIMAAAPVLSNEWVRLKALEFQYDATTPQNMILVDYAPQYEVIDLSKRIITRSFSKKTGVGVTILVAKNEPPEKLSALELASFDDYFRNTGDGTNLAVGLGHVGQNIVTDSLDPDLLFLEAEITYLGQYAATIQADCILAIETFISNVGKTPILKVSELINVLQSVGGFVDIFIENMATRAASVAFGSKTFLITSYTQSLTEIDITAGYMIGETTAANTLADKLTFTSI